jgi:hypothetical protein
MDQTLVGRSILILEEEPSAALEISQGLKAAGARTVMRRTIEGALAAAEDPTLSAVVFDRGFEGDSFELRARLSERAVPFIEHSGFGTAQAGAEGNRPPDNHGHGTLVAMLVSLLGRGRKSHADAAPSSEPRLASAPHKTRW